MREGFAELIISIDFREGGGTVQRCNCLSRYQRRDHRIDEQVESKLEDVDVYVEEPPKEPKFSDEKVHLESE